MYYFCTYFDQNYLPRALALYQSLQKQCPDFKLWALCMDEFSYNILSYLNLPKMQLISLSQFEEGDTALLAAKPTRSRVEYYFTCTPSLPLYILKHWVEVDLITYLDADLFFFADPAPIYTALQNYSIGIISHRFAPKIKYIEQHGKYNVGWLSFRRDKPSLVCLNWWREQCLEWCYDKPDGNRFGDQKYLDEWPHLFQGVLEIEHLGANLAPWNFDNYTLTVKDGQVWVNEYPLIFFHFQGLEIITSRLYNINLTKYKAKPSKVLLQNVYRGYIKKLLAFTADAIGKNIEYRQIRQMHFLYWRRLRYTIIDIVGRSYIISINDNLIDIGF